MSGIFSTKVNSTLFRRTMAIPEAGKGRLAWKNERTAPLLAAWALTFSRPAGHLFFPPALSAWLFLPMRDPISLHLQGKACSIFLQFYNMQFPLVPAIGGLRLQEAIPYQARDTGFRPGGITGPYDQIQVLHA